MMKSYVKFLSRNKLYATIEALGLSVALAFVLILFSYATAEYRVGTNLKQAKELYVAGSGDFLGMTWGTAKEFFPSIPEIKGWTRFGEYYAPQGAMIDGQYYEAKYLAIDPNFSQFMGYKCRGCAPDHLLSDAHQAMVSESFAKKAFGNANPIGRTIQCGKLQLKVVGIMEDFDREDLLNPYDIFVSMKLIEAEAQPMDQFGSCTTVARLAKDADPEKVRQTLLGKYMNYWKGWKKDSDGVSFMWGCQFVRWDQIHFTADSVDIFKHGNRTLVNILLVVALVLLLSALFNYINLTVAQIGNRAKEMATRRLLGESVGGVMLRYLKESALFTAVCFLLGLLISWAFIPLFNSMLDTKIDLFHSFDLLWFLPLAYVIISIFAGILPAIVVSRFNPIDVVKGTIRMRSKMWFSKIFIVAQNVISITLVVMAITMMLQMKHLADLPLGYQTKDIVSIFSSLDGSPEKMSILRNRLKALPEVEEATYGNANPISSWGNGVHDDNEKLIGMLRMFLADSTAMKMLGIRVIEQYCEPAYGKIWVTEDALSENEKTEHNAIGVITPQQGGWAVLVKTRGDHSQALQAIRSTCKQVAKELMGVPSEMEVEYMDDTLKNNLKDKHNMMVLIITFMSISILISALGLFGMSVYYGNQQKRQIALRKVMGASIGDAAWQLARRFLVSSLVAVVIAIPICVKLMQTYLMDFVHRISFPWWVLLAGAIFTLLIAFVSVIGCTLRTAMSNPIDSIKAE